jgi:ATP-dependent DNA helicase RecG
MTKLKPKECQDIEYKSNWHDDYLKWICGFANAQGAVLYIGVDDDHEVVGLDNVERLLEDIPNKIVTTMGIVADVNLHEHNGNGIPNKAAYTTNIRLFCDKYLW